MKQNPEEYLLDLIERMNSARPAKPPKQSISWHAHREAEKLANPAFYPLLDAIITSADEEANEGIRKRAYTIMGRLLKNCFEKPYVDFLLQRLLVETDRDIQVAIMDALSDIEVTDDLDASSLIAFANHPAWQLRFAALCALGSFSSHESKTALYDFLERDRKRFKDEIIYAIASLGRIGTADDIPALEKFLEVRIQDMKIAAEFAISRIKERV